MVYDTNVFPGRNPVDQESFPHLRWQLGNDIYLNKLKGRGQAIFKSLSGPKVLGNKQHTHLWLLGCVHLSGNSKHSCVIGLEQSAAMLNREVVVVTAVILLLLLL